MEIPRIIQRGYYIAKRIIILLIVTLAWVLLVEFMIFYSHLILKGDSFHLAEQLNASEVSAPLVGLVFVILVEFIACYASFGSRSRGILAIANIFGILVVSPFLLYDTLPLWWLMLVTFPMILIKGTIFWDQCVVSGARSG